MKLKDRLFITVILFISLQWAYFRFTGTHLAPPWNAISPGIAIFGAAFLLSWGAELAQFEIPQALAIAFLALVAVLPEYAVDMYFAWEAGKDPQYIHYATANMTGANRLLIGLGWAAVVLTSWFKTGSKQVKLGSENRLEISALLVATLYSFIIPIKGSLSWFDTIILLSIFAVYIYQTTQSHHEEPNIEGPIESIAHWKRGPRVMATLVFFFISGFIIFIAAEPFAEGLLETGRHLGVEEFLLVQWLAPLASESPEFIVAILFALRAQAKSSLSTLVSSKVNQWTLLVGMLPLIYNISAGHFHPMVLDSRQSEELLLTSAQSLFALVIIANLSFSVLEATILMALFVTQLFFTTTEARTLYAYVYLLFSLLWLIASPSSRHGLMISLQRSWRKVPE